MKLTQLALATGASEARAAVFLESLSAAMAFYHIDTPARQAAFLAQVGHESGGLKWIVELWGPTEAQKEYEPPSELAERLGNTQEGDGLRYRGRGPIQITGRANYTKVTQRLRERFDNVPNFVDNPEELTRTKWACLSATDYWDEHGLNALADNGDFRLITRRINGGLNGYQQRVALWGKAKEALSA